MSAIIPAFEDEARAVKPPTMRTCGISRVLGRTVLTWSPVQGDYGMGGAGFFQLTLAGASGEPDENLVLCLWGAGEWLMLNGTWIECHPRFYEAQKPLYSNFCGDECWDRVTALLAGVALMDFDLQDRSCRLKFSNDAVLELPEDTSLLPLSGGSLQPKALGEGDSLWDAWVLTKEQVLFI